MAFFKRTQSEKKTKSRGRIRLRAHTSAHSSEQYINTNIRSRSQRPYAATPTAQTRNKLRFGKKKRANSVGRKNKNRQSEQKVSEASIDSRYLSDQDVKITFTLQNIQNTINELDETHKSLKTEIQNKFEDIMIRIKQQQLNKEADLNDMVIKKKNILQSQLEELHKYQQNLKIIGENFSKNENKEVVLGFLNQNNNQKYNAQSIQCAVSSNILVNFAEEALNTCYKSISALGSIESGEVPLFAPIIKIRNKTTNSIQVKCFEPKNMDNEILAITQFEVEYILLPKQWKGRWKKMKKNIFEIINDENNFNNDDQKESKDDNKTSKCIVIDRNKNFKKNIVLINDLDFDCDYLIRCRCYNICGFGPWNLPKLISIYDINTDGHWQFNWEYFTDNLTVSDNDKTITKTNGKNEWDSLAKGPCFPINFIESQMKIYWNVMINNCYAADTGSLQFGIMHKKIKPEDVWSESIGFAEYDSMGMEKYEQSPGFKNGSIVKIVVDFGELTVEFYENDTFCAMQKLDVLKQKISDLCFGIGSYRKKNSITLM